MGSSLATNTPSARLTPSSQKFQYPGGICRLGVEDVASLGRIALIGLDAFCVGSIASAERVLSLHIQSSAREKAQIHTHTEAHVYI